MTIFHLDASGRHDGSDSRKLGRELVNQLAETGETVIYRDVADGFPPVDDLMISGLFLDDADRTDAQRKALETSDQLVSELQAADTIVIGTPIYNFSMPAALKSWADMVARKGVTFKYGPNGPIGLLEGKTAYVIITSGGTEIGSSIDFVSGWIKHFLGFIGISNATIIPADRLARGGDAKLAEIREAFAAAKEARDTKKAA